MGAVAVGCDESDPVKEDTPEMITSVTLTFVPVDDGDPVVVTASDPDGEGVQSLTVDGPITLTANKAYVLALSLVNGLADETDPSHDVTGEITAEADEHIFFYQWTEGLFTDPAGDGNIDKRTDPVAYNDADANGLPLGLITSWTTGAPASGRFRIVMKHQPGLKSETSTATMGESDLDLEFELMII